MKVHLADGEEHMPHVSALLMSTAIVFALVYLLSGPLDAFFGAAAVVLFLKTIDVSTCHGYEQHS